MQALTDVDFEVYAAEVVALVGDNGAGKSTLIKCISGAHLPDQGTIFIDGQEVKIHTPGDATRLGIATVYQDLALCDNLDVVANMFLGREEAQPRGDRSAPGARDGEALARRAERPPGDHRQERAPNGCHALGGPTAVGRDLPGRHVECEGRHPGRADSGARRCPDGPGADLVKRLREQGLGVVIITHNLHEVFEVSDRIIVLRLGRRAATFRHAETTPEEVVAAITGARAEAASA